MNEKEMIEEMAKDIFEYVDTKKQDNVYILHSGIAEDMKTLTHNYGLAEYLYKHGYRKIPEGSIVLSAKDIETTCKHCRSKYYKIIEELEEQRDRQAYIAEDLIQEKHRWTEQARKETAKEIYLEMIGEFEPYIATEIAKEIAKKYGVEVEE